MIFICSLVVPAYFLRLLADGVKLRTKLLELAEAARATGQGGEAPLTKSGYAAWTSPPYYPETQASSGDQRRAS